MVEYAIIGAVVLLAVVFYFLLVPGLAKSSGVVKYKELIYIAIDLVKAIEQEFKSGEPVKTPEMTDEEYKALKEEYGKKKKEACMQTIKQVLAEYKIKIPSDEVLSKVIETAVWIMNEGKNLLKKM